MTAFASSVLFLYLNLPVVFGGRAATPCQPLPENIRVSEALRPSIVMLAAKSPTFRRQCAKIAASPNVYVGVAMATTSLGPGTRAHAVARRYETGILIVSVQIPPASEYIELVAHELEHVTELIEGEDLRALAIDQPASVTRRRDDGAFETRRARAAGEAAAYEVYGPIDPTLGAMGRGLLRAGRTVWSVVAPATRRAPTPGRRDP